MGPASPWRAPFCVPVAIWAANSSGRPASCWKGPSPRHRRRFCRASFLHMSFSRRGAIGKVLDERSWMCWPWILTTRRLGIICCVWTSNKERCISSACELRTSRRFDPVVYSLKVLLVHRRQRKTADSGSAAHPGASLPVIDHGLLGDHGRQGKEEALREGVDERLVHAAQFGQPRVDGRSIEQVKARRPKPVAKSLQPFRRESLGIGKFRPDLEN